MKLNGYAVREIRSQAGQTVTAAAKSAGVSQPAWSNWERGERQATAANVIAICTVLGIKDYRAILCDPANVDLSELDGAAA